MGSSPTGAEAERTTGAPRLDVPINSLKALVRHPPVLGELDPLSAMSGPFRIADNMQT